MSHATTDNPVIEDERSVDGRRLLEENSLVEAGQKFFGYPTPWILASLAIVGWIARLWVGGWSWWDLGVAALIVGFWPLQEWLIHVFVLHFKPANIFGRTVDMHVAKKHRVHHQRPWLLEHVFIPLRSLLVGLPIGLGLWFLVAPSLEVAIMAVAVYATFGLTYEWTHYLVHTNYKPQTKFYRRLWQNHRLHHFKNEQYWYGVSMLSGDRLLGTAPDFKQVESSETCRTLGIAECETID